MNIDFLLNVFEEFKSNDAFIWRERSYTYGWLSERLRFWSRWIDEQGVSSGSVVIIEADFSPNAVALFLALIEHDCILTPLTSSVADKRNDFIEIAEGQAVITLGEDDEVSISMLERAADHPFYRTLRERGHPGLVLFSSGSTGDSKAAVHDLVDLLEKFRVRRASLRAISFLLFDHIGGVNTMLYTLANGGCLVTVRDRSPQTVLDTIDQYQVELLPTSPTFLNLVLLSEAFRSHDLSSLKTVTYGTEPMPETTLKRFNSLYPHIRMLQTYGLSEVGILRSKSKSSDSLWVKVGGEGFQTRVVDGILQIKAQSAMLGYLNAPSPFTSDGWFDTGDSVLVDGEYIRILGRKSELINVGGEKFYPIEVESVIQTMENVAGVTVYTQKNAITGNICCADVTLKHEESRKELSIRLKKYCQERLAPFKVPVKVRIVEREHHSGRFKKIRSLSQPNE